MYHVFHAGALDRLEREPGLYSELVFRSENVKSVAFDEIERDLHRSGGYTVEPL